MGKKKEKNEDAIDLPKRGIEERAKMVQADMLEVADSLEFIASTIIEPDAGPAWIQDFTYAMLMQRIEHIKEKAHELFLDLDVAQLVEMERERKALSLIHI